MYTRISCILLKLYVDTTSQDAAIGSDLFKQYIKLFNKNIAHESDQIMEYTVNLVAFNGLDTNATTSMYVKINKPPEGGSCEIDPLQGVALQDKFKIDCWDWQDPEGIGIRFKTSCY